MQGTVRVFMAERGYGFSDGADDQRYDANREDVPGGVPLVPGQIVAFAPTPTVRGARARASASGPAPALISLPSTAWIDARPAIVRGDVAAREAGTCAAWGRDLDAMRDRLREAAASRGANAVLGLRRAQQRSGSWLSPYRWTAHGLAGRAVLLLRPVSTTDAARIARRRPLRLAGAASRPIGSAPWRRDGCAW